MRWAAAALLLLAALGGCRARQPETLAVGEPGVLRVATSGDYAPFSVVNADGALTGMDVAVAQRLAGDLGLRVEIVRVAWPQLTAATVGGRFDIAMGGITMRPERALVGRFTRPYAEVGALALIRRRDAERFASIEMLDRSGVRIAVNGGGHLERLARARFSNATIEPQAENETVPERLRDGAVDAAITDTAEVDTWMSPGVIALGPFSLDYKAYLLPAADAALAAQVDAWMIAREQDGWLDAERRRWIGPDASLDPAAAARLAVLAFVRLRLELAPAIGAAKRAAGLPIEDREREARVLARVGEAAGTQRNRVARVYAELIELSKAAQGGGAASEVNAELPALRDALARIDAALVPALVAVPATDEATWSALLSAAITLPGVDPAALDRLASRLATG